MHKFTKNFLIRSPSIATFVRNIKRFAKLARNVVCMRFSLTTPRDVTVTGAVKLKQGVILNPEFHYFDKDRISTESFLLKAFLPVRLIHRFTSPFQLSQLQYSMVLQLAAAERKKRPASKRAIGNGHIRVCYVIPQSLHMRD